ncbi:DEAD/DEAH box helicase [Planotetraspora phitsanulokensis]|uniref:DEAD/DEAH box helicase n=1 Tax=Planotetraspora phitsanulokensis TaxID=575192 RepID=UPI00194E5EF1|nr:DEAD/DEAH box helicase [Planotetraspora phitsanulokensis]
MTKRLRELPVTDMIYEAPRISTAALHNGGLHTAADVQRQQARLGSIPGIGPAGVRKLHEGLKNARRLTASDLRPPASSEEWREEDEELVRALHAYAETRFLAQSPQWDVLRPLASDLNSVQRATKWWPWTFSTKRSRQQTRDLYDAARRRARSPLTGKALEKMAREIDHVHRLSSEPQSGADLRATWQRSSASLLSLLERFTLEEGDPQEKASVLHGLTQPLFPPDLAARIEAQPLDLTLVRRDLRLYQQFGAKFALVVEQALLGDEMGLGKTIEALAAIAHAIEHDSQHHHLVICPASLIDNWLQEIDETLHKVAGHAYRGPDAADTLRRWNIDRGILVVSFNQANKLADEVLPQLGFVVVDEAHYVKNPETSRTQTAATLMRRGRRALVMGGTPMENKAKEFIDLAALVSPAKGQRLREIFGDGTTAHIQDDKFRREIAHVYLRRNQKEVLEELPTLIWHDELIQVGKTESKAYNTAIADHNLMDARRKLSTANGPNSAKMKYLSEIARECKDGGRKLLVFSFFSDVVSTAKSMFGDECGEISGAVPQSRRDHLIDEFTAREGFAVLALQIEIGGTGLNIQAASVVVIMEPQYKPTTEWQAVGRAYRMGQTERVMVHRLIAKNTVETGLVARTNFKADVFNRIARPSDLAKDIDALLEAQPVDEQQYLDEEWRRIQDHGRAI